MYGIGKLVAYACIHSYTLLYLGSVSDSIGPTCALQHNPFPIK